MTSYVTKDFRSKRSVQYQDSGWMEKNLGETFTYKKILKRIKSPDDSPTEVAILCLSYESCVKLALWCIENHPKIEEGLHEQCIEVAKEYLENGYIEESEEHHDMDEDEWDRSLYGKIYKQTMLINNLQHCYRLLLKLNSKRINNIVFMMSSSIGAIMKETKTDQLQKFTKDMVKFMSTLETV